MFAGEALLSQFVPAALKHFFRIVEANELDLLADSRGEMQQCVTGRATQVVNARAIDGKVCGHFCDHALHLFIERYGAKEHVIEDGGNFFSKSKVGDRRLRFSKNFVSRRGWLS